MKHGDQVLLKRGKKRYACTVVSDHTALFPAVTVMRGVDEWVVGINEILTPEEIKAEEEARKAEEAKTVADVVEAFKNGHTTVRSIADSMGKQMIYVLSRCRKAERLGLIKLDKQQPKYPPGNQPANEHTNTTAPSKSEPTESMPNLQP